MTTTVTTHRRGFFGRVWQILFWLFQAVMIALVVINITSGTELAAECDGNTACEAGTAVGAGIVAAAGWFVWILGTVILGTLMLATRGKSVTKEV